MTHFYFFENFVSKIVRAFFALSMYFFVRLNVGLDVDHVGDERQFDFFVDRRFRRKKASTKLAKRN